MTPPLPDDIEVDTPVTKSSADIAEDLVAVLAILADYASPNRVIPTLDAGQRLMLAEAWRRCDQVFNELAAFAITDQPITEEEGA